MGTKVLRRVAAVFCITLGSAPTAWGIDPVPNALPAAGYPAGLPASPIKDLTPTDFLTQPGHDTPGGHADLIPHEESQAEPGLVGSFEYLLLRPRRGNLDFALVSGTTAPTPIGRTEALNFDRNSGVRAAVGYRLPENWDATFAYTYFRASAAGATAAPPGGILYPTLTRPGFVDSALVGGATAGFLQNVYDVEFGRRFQIGETCSARVFGGFRFADLKQDFTATYDGRDAAGSVVSTTNNFQGFGPMVGAEGTLSVWRKLQLYARASGGLLTGTSSAGLTETNQNGQSVYASYDSSTRKVVPVCGVGIGAGWQSGRLSVRAGYEITYWGSLIDSTRISSDFSPGKTTTTTDSLSLEGFFFRLGWEF